MPKNYQQHFSNIYKQLYDHRFDNLDELDQLLGRQSLPKFTQEETIWIGLYLSKWRYFHLKSLSYKCFFTIPYWKFISANCAFTSNSIWFKVKVESWNWSSNGKKWQVDRNSSGDQLLAISSINSSPDGFFKSVQVNAFIFEVHMLP